MSWKGRMAGAPGFEPEDRLTIGQITKSTVPVALRSARLVHTDGPHSRGTIGTLKVARMLTADKRRPAEFPGTPEQAEHREHGNTALSAHWHPVRVNRHVSGVCLSNLSVDASGRWLRESLACCFLSQREHLLKVLDITLAKGTVWIELYYKRMMALFCGEIRRYI